MTKSFNAGLLEDSPARFLPFPFLGSGTTIEPSLAGIIRISDSFCSVIDMLKLTYKLALLFFLDLQFLEFRIFQCHQQF